MATLLRTVGVIVLAVVLIILMRLPDDAETRRMTTFEGLTDFDFSGEAAALWSAGEQEKAIGLLDYLIDNGHPDAGNAESKKKGWLQHVRGAANPLAGRPDAFAALRLLGREAADARGTTWEQLSGDSVADHFVTANLDRALGDAAKGDPFHAGIGKAALLTEFFPPAVSAMNVLRAAKVEGALTEPLERALTEAASKVKADSRASLRPLWNAMIPIWELARNSRTWSQFKTCLSACTSLQQVKVLTAFVAKEPGNARRLEQILTVTDRSPGLARKAIGYAHQRGAPGLTTLHNALRKGVPGVQFVLSKPGFTPRSLRGSLRRRAPLYTSLLLKYGNKVRVVRFILVTIVIACLLALARIWQFIRDAGVNVPSSNAGNGITVLVLGGAICALLFMISPSSRQTLSSIMPGQSAEPGERAATGGVSFACFLSALLLQLWALTMARKKLEQVREETGHSIAVKIEHLDNLDTYFDLPLYIGLAGSVGGFMLLTFYPTGGRILAYSSTVVGIFVSLFLKLRLLMPYRQYLIDAQAGEEDEQ